MSINASTSRVTDKRMDAIQIERLTPYLETCPTMVWPLGAVTCQTVEPVPGLDRCAALLCRPLLAPCGTSGIRVDQNLEMA